MASSPTFDTFTTSFSFEDIAQTRSVSSRLFLTSFSQIIHPPLPLDTAPDYLLSREWQQLFPLLESLDRFDKFSHRHAYYPPSPLRCAPFLSHCFQLPQLLHLPWRPLLVRTGQFPLEFETLTRLIRLPLILRAIST